VAAIPGQQEVHGMNRCQGNMQGIKLCRRRKPAIGNQPRSESFDLGVND
jgi:hypothetical protein